MRLRRTHARVWALGLIFFAALIGLAVPATASAAPLDCSGATIFAVQRPTQSTSNGGIVFALQANTLSDSSVTATPVTTMPSNTYPNALGVAPGGTGLYTVEQSGSTGTATIDAFSTSTGFWTQYAGTGGTPSQFVAGAVDPVNGIYYYADYGTTTATLYGFNTETNTPIPGIIATFALPDGSGSQNGDFTFDQSGNLYVLASTGSVRAVGVVQAPLPTTGSDASLSDTTLSSVSDTRTYNGIAFDNLGQLYIESLVNGANATISTIDPNSGAVIEGPTPISSNAQTWPDVDLASCAKIPTLSVQTSVAGRVSPTDQFGLSITGGTITQGNTATTSGSETSVQAGPVIGSSGTSYTVSETATNGDLSRYDVTYSCVDTTNGDATVASGTGTSFSLPFPTMTLGQATPSPSVSCTFSTTPKAADLAIANVASSATALPGGQVDYTLTVTNNGPDPATAAAISDPLPSGMSAANVSPSQGSCSGTTTVSCSLGTIANGATATVDVTADVATTATPGATTNTATVSNANETDPDPENNSAGASVQIDPAADLAITNVPTSASTLPGGQVDYTVTVDNDGPDAATAAAVSDPLPSGLTATNVTPSQGTCSGTTTVTCSLGTIANGGTATIAITAHVATTATPGATTATATVTNANETDPDPENNSAGASVQIDPAADLAITNVPSSTSALAGGDVTYTLTVTNNGPDAATGTHVSDPLPSGLTATSVTASQGSCTGTTTVTCTLGTIADGETATVTITAGVAGSASGTTLDTATVSNTVETDPVSANNTASALVQIDPAADLAVTNTASASSVTAGGQVTYTIEVTNNGPDTATNTLLTDPIPTGLTAGTATASQGSCTIADGAVSCSLGSLADGATATITIVATAGAGADGATVDTATASADEADPVTANDGATAAVQITPAPAPAPTPAPTPAPSTPAPSTPAPTPTVALTVGLQVSQPTVELGQALTYTLTVGNDGPDTAPAVDVVDTPTGPMRILSIVPSQGTCAATLPLNCQLGALGPHGTVRIVIRAIPLAVGSAISSASATIVCTTQADCPTDTSAHKVTAVTAAVRAFLRLATATDHRVIQAGAELTYKLKVSNPTLATLHEVRVCDQLPLGLVYVRSNAHVTLRDGRLCWSLGSLRRHGTKTITVLVRALRGSKGTLTDHAVASAADVEPVKAKRRVRVTPAPVLPPAEVTG